MTPVFTKEYTKSHPSSTVAVISFFKGVPLYEELVLYFLDGDGMGVRGDGKY